MPILIIIIIIIPIIVIVNAKGLHLEVRKVELFVNLDTILIL